LALRDWSQYLGEEVAVTFSNQVLSGQSIAAATPALANEQSVPRPSVVTGGNPNTIVQAAAAAASGATVRIPLDTPQYWMKMELNTYKRQSWDKVGDLTPHTTIILPLPLDIKDIKVVHYENQPLGVAGALSLGAAAQFINNQGQLDTAKGREAAARLAAAVARGGDLTGEELALQAAIVAGRVAAGATGNLGAGVMAGLGVAVNDFMVMMLKGPMFKKYSYTWKISPKSEQESNMLSRFYKLIQEAKSPGLPSGAGAMFFTYPDIVNLTFQNATMDDLGPRLFKHKPSFIEATAFNFTPTVNGPAFYGKTKAPESVEFEISFVEIEYWLKGQDAGGM
jgi:hypothetical protein